MERSGDLLTSSALNGVAVQADEVGSISRGHNVDAGIAQFLCQHIGEIYNTRQSHIKDARAMDALVADSQFNSAKEDSQAFGAAGRTHVLPLVAAPAFPTPAASGLTHLIARSQMDFGSLSAGKDNMCCLRKMGDSSLEPSQVQSGKSDMQLSSVCQRRFAMFDHTVSKNQMFSHPVMANKITSIPLKLQTVVADNQDPLSVTSSQKVKFPSSSSPLLIAPSCALPFIHDPYSQPANANMEFSIHLSDTLLTPFSVHRDIETRVEFNELDCIAEFSDSSHEDTGDLDALLSSDEDEVSSTGHSPSDITRQMSLKESPRSQEDNECLRKRRKRESEVGLYDDDARSLATSGNGMHCCEGAIHKEDIACQVDVCRLRSVGGLSGEDSAAALKMVVADESSSSSSAYRQKRLKKSCVQQEQQQSLPTNGQSRKEKIRSILHLLRRILPGGESMDAMLVLDEAIQYVKALQSEVRKLHAWKLINKHCRSQV